VVTLDWVATFPADMRMWLENIACHLGCLLVCSQLPLQSYQSHWLHQAQLMALPPPFTIQNTLLQVLRGTELPLELGKRNHHSLEGDIMLLLYIHPSNRMKSCNVKGSYIHGHSPPLLYHAMLSRILKFLVPVTSCWLSAPAKVFPRESSREWAGGVCLPGSED
jgi:hypothetical protein